MTNITMTGQTDVEFDVPSSYVLDPQMRRDLREPFPPSLIGKVNKGFGQVDFIGHAAITDRLNQAAPGWTYRVEPVVIQGKDGLPHVMAVFGTMTVGGVTRQEVGDVEHMSRYGDELKKAISDFIVRGAMRFGVGLDLWSKEDLLESPSRETPAGVPSLSAAGEQSAPIRGRSAGAEAGGRVETSSSASRKSSGEGTTTAADEQGHRGTTADPSSDHVPPAAGPRREAKSPSRGAATTGESERTPTDQTPGGRTGKASAPLSPAGGPKTYPLAVKDCMHTVGVDVQGRCVDCGALIAEAAS